VEKHGPPLVDKLLCTGTGKVQTKKKVTAKCIKITPSPDVSSEGTGK